MRMKFIMRKRNSNMQNSPFNTELQIKLQNPIETYVFVSQQKRTIMNTSHLKNCSCSTLI